ncbi:MAG: hypothetical protein EPO23_12255 [Xanthobacteraceae bacterium]|nr:MAG: hypothetical protein EPO23_12255 [Xanthobacteraceae bacterium]
MKKILFIVAVICVLIFVVLKQKDRLGFTPEAQQTSQESSAEQDENSLSAAIQLNAQWEETFDKTGKFPDRQDPAFHTKFVELLAFISPRSPSYAAAQALREKFEVRQKKINNILAAQRRDAIKADSEGRVRVANTFEETFLKKGLDVSITVSGRKNTTLEISYVLMNRPLVYKITNEFGFLERAWNLGFEKVILSNGYGLYTNRWVYEVPKSWLIQPY